MKRAFSNSMIYLIALSLLAPSAAHAAGFVPAGSLSAPRYAQTETLLPNGKVLVSGGNNSGELSAADLYDPAAPVASAWSSAGNMTTSRQHHTATVLSNGKVLIAGGANGNSLSSAELYDPAAPPASAWSSAGGMAVARDEHTATLLGNGKVLVTGGGSNTCELYDPVANSWSLAPNMSASRKEHTATLLANGKVIVTGGLGSGSGLSSAELYDPVQNSWSAAASMSSARFFHRAVLLAGGKVLVIGGRNNNVLSTAELYDPAANNWSAAGTMSTPRYLETATVLQSGKVLVAGGEVTSGSFLRSAEIYDPAAPAVSAWSSAGNMNAARSHNSAALLQNGKVLIVAGGSTGGVNLSSAEAYDPAFDGSIVRYNFDEGAGTVANDASGNGNNGTLTNGPTWTTGVHGSALSFDGVDDYLNVPAFSWSTGGPVTVAFWNYVSSNPQLPDGYTFGAGTDPNQPMSALIPHPSGVVYWDYGGRLSFNNYAPYMDKWTHVALVSGGNGGNFRAIYLNGQMVASAAVSNGPTVPLTGLHIGHNSEFALGTRHSRCKIDDFRIYNRVLPGVEIAGLALPNPTAANDSYAMKAGDTLNVSVPGVLANDAAPVSDTLMAVRDLDVSHGTLTLNSNGSFTYVPANGFAGTDSFTYHADNGHGSVSSPATVTIQVLNLTVTSISTISGTVGQSLPNLTIAGTGFRIALIPSNSVSFGGHNYLYVNTPMTWSAAKAYCEGLGGHLATISSAPENQFVFNLGLQQRAWLGGTDELAEGTFVWVTGEPFAQYTNWRYDQPDNNDLGQVENYMDFYPGGGGTWNDGRGSLTETFVCEFDHVPTSLKIQKGVSVIAATNVRVNSTSQMLADFNLTGAASGAWDVVAVDETGVTGVLPGAFQINLATTATAAATASAIVYKFAAQSTTLSAAVTSQYGTLNEGTVTFQLKSGGNDIGSAVTSGTLVNGATGNVTYTVPAGTPPGAYSISATYNGTSGYLGSSDTSKQLTINPATITVTGSDSSRAYGAANPNFTGTLTGVQAGDGIIASFATSATVLSAAGTYPIVPTLVDPSNKLSNYLVISTNGTLTVTKAPLTAVAFNSTRTYGAANPLLSGILSGVLNGDNILATYDTSANTASPVGIYAIVPQLIDPDGKAGNYSASLSNGALTVTKAALAVTPADASRPYGAPNPAFSGTITGIQNNDNITATYATSAGPSSTVGTYAISAALVDPDNRLSNYTATFGVGTLSVNKAAPVIVWALPARIVAGTALSAVQLNAAAQDAFSAAPLAGTFDYSPVDGTLLSAGLGQVLSVTFTPADAVNYIAASAQTNIDVDPAVPPTITSALSASAAKDTPFSYTVTVDGTAPIALNATGLPPGLSFSGADITGAPSATGVFYITLTATNFGGSDSKALKLTVLGTGTNHSPLMTSPLTVSANPATTATPVTFLAQATDEDGDALDYVWDFGDGTSGLGASVSKTYAAPGVYIASLTVSDGQSSATQSLNLVVNDQPATGAFSVQKVKLAFNFAKIAKDSLNISGQIPVAPGFVPESKSVRVLIGLLNVQTTLTSKGRSADRTFTLIGKRGSNVAKFTFALKNQDLFAKLPGLGFSKTQSNPAIIMPVIVVLDGQSYLDRPAIAYTAKSNKSGPSSGKGKK